MHVASSPKRKLMALGVALVATVGLLSGCLTQDQQTVQSLINADRTANGVATLTDYAAADAKAQAWADHLALDPSVPPVLTHTTLADGYQAGTWCHLGENVGAGPSIESIEPAFMASPLHRANILDPNYDHVGTGVAKNATSGYVFVVQEFVDLC
jgi:uncharacterized protein YkwD